MIEHETLRNLTLDELLSVREGSVSYFSIESAERESGREYTFDFILEHPHGPYIKMDTEERKDFLARGTEQEAQEALVKLAKKVTSKTGGYFDIHPFYGAVYGTKLTQVSPDFFAEFAELDKGLTMIIFLTEHGDKFDNRLTKESQRIGTTVTIPGTNSRSFLNYLKDVENTQNPNQGNKDQAVINDLKKPWENQFKKFNGGKKTKPMRITPINAVNLIKSLQPDGIEAKQVSRVTLKTQAK